MHIILIGLRGAGKTTVGRELAAQLRRPFIDLDDVVVRRLGAVSVREVFSAVGTGRGETAWRTGEAEALDALLDAPLATSVIALGSGAPMVQEIARRLRREREARRIIVVHLRCASAVAAVRLAAAPGDRTSLTGRGIVEELESLEQARTPRYSELGDLEVDASANADVVLQRVVAALSNIAA